MLKKLTYSSILVASTVLSSCSSNPSKYISHKPLKTPVAVLYNGNIGDGPIIGADQNEDEFSSITSTILGDLPGKSIKHPFETSTVYFAYDSAIIGQAYGDLIFSLSQYIKTNPTFNLTIGGHSDERGSDEYNRSLAERRALSVKQALLDLGVSTQRLNTVSYGEDQPAAKGSTHEVFSKNRRAEFQVFDMK